MIEITRPLMTLLDEFGEPIEGVSKSASEVEAMEKASRLPDGTYYLTRPNAKIVVDRGWRNLNPSQPLIPSQNQSRTLPHPRQYHFRVGRPDPEPVAQRAAERSRGRGPERG